MLEELSPQRGPLLVLFSSGVFDLSTVDILAQIILCRGDYSVHYGMLSSISGPDPLETSIIFPLFQCNNRKCLWTLLNVPGGKTALLEMVPEANIEMRNLRQHKQGSGEVGWRRRQLIPSVLMSRSSTGARYHNPGKGMTD